jgi:hypothetical protein
MIDALVSLSLNNFPFFIEILYVGSCTVFYFLCIFMFEMCTQSVHIYDVYLTLKSSYCLFLYLEAVSPDMDLRNKRI